MASPAQAMAPGGSVLQRRSVDAMSLSLLSAASIEAYLQSIAAIPVLSAEEEEALARKACREQDRDAAQTLILSNLRFVAYVARSYLGYGLPLSDLIQEGNIGLIKALKRFDPDVGVRLISFAVHWIKAEIHDFIFRNWRIVRLATTKAQRRLFFNIRKNRRHTRLLNLSEAKAIAADLKVKTEEVLEMEARMAFPDASISASAEPGRGGIPESLIEDPRNEFEALEEREWTRTSLARVKQGLGSLDARSRDIIERRWLMQGEPAGLEQLGEKYQVSAERVRQIQNSAMRRLRRHVEAPAGVALA